MPLTTESADTDDVLDIEDFPAEPAADDPDGAPAAPSKQPISVVRRAILFGVATVVTVAALAGWLGFRAYQAHQWQVERSVFLQAARQGATNLTTIDWQQADRDVQRILDGAAGQFYDDFAKRSQPFIDVVKKAKSTTAGTITKAGLESQSADSAQVLVAVTVTTSNAGAPQPDPHGWRLRVAVQRVGDQIKVSNVEFVQ
ncbi:MAG: Mce-associated rane protein [Mycobacterium sp.]|nr:Mce-associated rane protein [Mycobacterium sp.]